MSAKASGGPATQPIGVFVLDDQEIVRRGVRALLEAEPDIRVIGEAGTASSALARIPALRPDVAVLDVRLPDGDGVSVCREIRSRLPNVACLMFTAFSDNQALLDSIMAGAAGYVLKQVRGCDLVRAVRTAASGQSLLNSRAASKVMARLLAGPGKPDPLARLTPHEYNVLSLIGEGLTNRQIGERLFIAEKTVKTYVSTLFRKLGLKQRTAAAAYAARIFNGPALELRQDMWITDRTPRNLTRASPELRRRVARTPTCLTYRLPRSLLVFISAGSRNFGLVPPKPDESSFSATEFCMLFAGGERAITAVPTSGTGIDQLSA